MRSRGRLVLGVLAVLVLSQALNISLGVASFRSSYDAAVLADLGSAAGRLGRELSSALAFGRPLNRVPGVDSTLAELRAAEPRILGAAVLGPEGGIVYRSGEELEPPPASELPSSAAARPLRVGGRARLLLPVLVEGRPAAFLDLAYDEAALGEAVGGIYRRGLLNSGLVLIPAALLVLLLFSLLGRRAEAAGPAEAHRAARRRLAAVGAVLVASQVAAGLLNLAAFRASFLGLASSSVEAAAGRVSEDLDLLLGRGLRLERMRRLEGLLDARRRANPVIGGIEVRDASGELLYAASAQGVFSRLESGGAAAPGPREGAKSAAGGGGSTRDILGEGGRLGSLRVYADSGFVEAKLRELGMDSLTLLLVTLVISFEFLGFILLLSGPTSSPSPSPGEASEGGALRLIRSTAFVFFTAAFFPLSFLPLYIESLLPPGALLGLPPGAWLSLPLSANLLGVTLLIPIIALVSRRRNFRLVYAAGGLVFALGTALSALAQDVLALTLFRFIAGCGYGAVITNSTTLVVGLSSREGRTRGFGALSAGIASATICAMPVGGILVNRLGLRAGMLTAALLSLLALLFLVFYSGRARLGEAAETGAGLGFKLGDLGLLLRSRRLAAALLFSSLPYLLADTGVFAFVFPLYMDSLSVGTADIGRVMTLYGLIALAVPLVARRASVPGGHRRFLILGALISGAALTLFLVSESPWTFVLVVLLMGLGLMMSDAVKEAFVAESPEAERLGETRILGFFETAEKILGMMVPLAVGLLLSALGYARGVALIGAFSLLSALLLALLTRHDPRGASRAGGGSEGGV